MLEELLPLKLPPGLYRNGTRYQAKGRWYGANLVRFYEGAIRPVQGWRVAFDTNGNPLPVLLGVPRAALGWRAATGEPLLAVGTTAALYVIKEGGTYDITPTDFTAGADDAGTAGNGNYGDGLYGVGLYGVGRAPLAGALTDADTWQLDAFGDVLVACPTNGGRIYAWLGNTSTPADVADATAPENCRGVVITPERFVVALGAAGDVRLVQWASQATLDTWAPAVDNTAGDYTLPTNGRIMGGRRTKAQTLIWTDADLYSMNYVGGDVVYSFKQEGDNCGIISPQAVAVVDTTALWMGRSNFFAYDGYVKPIPCEVSDYVFGSFNQQQASKVFACPVSEFSEVWWFYPSAGSVENDRYVVYNYREGHWTTGTLSRTAAIDRGALPSPVMFDSTGTVYQHEQSGGSRQIPLPVVISDTLVDTNAVQLEDHTPSGPTAFSWVKVSGVSLVFASNHLKKTGAGAQPLYTADADPQTGTYEASVRVTLPAGPYTTVEFAGIVGLMDGSTAQGIYFGIRTDTPTLVLYGLDSAGAPIFTEQTIPIPFGLVGTTVQLTLRIATGGVLTGLVNGLQMLQVTDATLTAGKAGIAGGSVGASGGAADITDAMTATDGATLLTHNPSTGTWAQWGNSNAHASTVASNKLVFANDGTGTKESYLHSATPSSDDYSVACDVTIPSGSTDKTGPIVRGTSGVGGYALLAFGSSGASSQVKLVKLNTAGTDIGTVLATLAPAGLVPGQTYTLTLRCVGTAIEGYVDGALVLSATDSAFTTGKPGLYSTGSELFGSHPILDNWEFRYIVVAGSDLFFEGNFVLSGVTAAEQTAGETTGTVTFDAAGQQNLVPFLESGPIELGDGDRVMRVQRIVPDEKNLGDVEMRFFAALQPTDTETEQGPYTLSAPTGVRFAARQVRVRIEEVRPVDWRVGVTRLGVIAGGRR